MDDEAMENDQTGSRPRGGFCGTFWAEIWKVDIMEPHRIRLLIADVDGTLLNARKGLSPVTIKAIQDLQRAGIRFSLVSHRPLQGLQRLMEALRIGSACAALNGGVIVDDSFTVVSEKSIRSAVVQEVVGTIERHGLDPWIYTRTFWYVTRLDRSHVRHEAEALEFSPTRFESLGEIAQPVIKVAAVSDNYSQVAACEDQLGHRLGTQLSISRALANHLDVSHPDANKGAAVTSIAKMLNIPLEEVATAGDGENDIPMFRVSGLSIAMGQAPAEVHRAATHTTTSSSQDGLAWAIQDLILKHQSS